MNKDEYNKFIYIIIFILLILILSNIGLFLRLNRLENAIISSNKELIEVIMSNSGSSVNHGLDVGTEAPDFALASVNDNTSIVLSHYLGSRVLLVFASPSCASCQDVYPKLKDFTEKRSDIVTIMISLGTEEENRNLVSQMNFNFPVLGWNNDVARNYQVPGTPFFYLIDEKGLITASGGSTTADNFDHFVNIGM